MTLASSGRDRWVVWGGFVLLCLVASAEWVIPPPAAEVSPLEVQGAMYAVIGLSATAWIRYRRLPAIGSMQKGRIALSSVLFLGVPAILLTIVDGVIPSTSLSFLFALTPVVVMLAVSTGDRRSRDSNGLQNLLAPALAGLGGLLCVLPLRLPDSTSEWIAFAVVVGAVVQAGIAGAQLHLLLRGGRIALVFAVSGISNAALLLLWCGLRGTLIFGFGGFAASGTLLEVARMVEILLTLWLVREMAPIAFSARYLAIPLLTILEGFAAMRPGATVRLTAGMLLMGVGVWRIVAAKPEYEDESLSLR